MLMLKDPIAAGGGGSKKTDKDGQGSGKTAGLEKPNVAADD